MRNGSSTGRAIASKRRRTAETRRCNLCSRSFRPHGGFDRYCRDCRKQSELLRFSEWMPDASAIIELAPAA